MRVVARRGEGFMVQLLFRTLPGKGVPENADRYLGDLEKLTVIVGIGSVFFACFLSAGASALPREVLNK